MIILSKFIDKKLFLYLLIGNIITQDNQFSYFNYYRLSIFSSKGRFRYFSFQVVYTSYNIASKHEDTFRSGLINNVYTGSTNFLHGVQNSSIDPLDGRRVHAAGSLMEDVIGKYLARLRSIRHRVCSRYATNRVIARILLL